MRDANIRPNRAQLGKERRDASLLQRSIADYRRAIEMQAGVEVSARATPPSLLRARNLRNLLVVYPSRGPSESSIRVEVSARATPPSLLRARNLLLARNLLGARNLLRTSATSPKCATSPSVPRPLPLFGPACRARATAVTIRVTAV